MIAINASGHAKLNQVNNPIALFSVVNTVYMKFYRGLGLAMVSTHCLRSGRPTKRLLLPSKELSHLCRLIIPYFPMLLRGNTILIDG